MKVIDGATCASLGAGLLAGEVVAANEGGAGDGVVGCSLWILFVIS